VAIIDAYASPTIAADANQWSVNRGLPQLKATQFTQVVAPGTYHHPESGKKQDPQGWYGEETLDAEAVHGMAPDANIVYVGAPNDFQDLDAALNYAVDKVRRAGHVQDQRRDPPVGMGQRLPRAGIHPLHATLQGFLRRRAGRASPYSSCQFHHAYGAVWG
jgi:hypothetical protein